MSNGKHRLAVMVAIETDDPALDPETIDVGSVEATTRLRAAVIANLPKLTGVIAVMDEDAARTMMYAHDAAMRMAGLGVQRPPSDYKPPGRKP